MFCKRSYAYPLAMFVFASAAPILAEAGSAAVPKFDADELRALFHSPAFSVVCPLVVYDEDYSSSTASRRPASAAHRADAPAFNGHAATVIRENIRGDELNYSDGLNDYGENLNIAGMLR